MADLVVQWLIFPPGSFPLPEGCSQMGKVSQKTLTPCPTFPSLVSLTEACFNKAAD